MRAVGAGRAKLGELELDLTAPPAPLHSVATDEPATLSPSAHRARILHPGGRVRLPVS